MTNMSEAVQLLSDGGVIARLKEEKQAPRELKRAQLMVELAQVEQAEAIRGAEVMRVRATLDQKIARLESELRAAQQERRVLTDPTGFTVQRLRGELRKLADPRIEQTIGLLHDLGGKARQAFSSSEIRVKRLRGYETNTVSNAAAINEVQDRIRAAVGELEALQEAMRPDNLEDVLAGMVDPIKLAVQRLHGFN